MLKNVQLYIFETNSLSMDFNQIDLKKFLKAAIKVRFQGISPYDFEDFLGKLFSDNGYTISPTKYAGDYGADLILKKDGLQTVVQIKRYHPDHKVGVQDVNQVIGAAKYYKADQIMIVTTSQLTLPAIELCRKASVFVWDWDILKEAIYKTYDLDDEWLFDISTDDPEDDDEYFDFYVLEVTPDQYIGDSKIPLTRVVMEMHNKSGRNVNVFLDLPILLRHNNKQFSAVDWVENYFKSGIIYNGADVEIACYYLEENLADIRRGDHILIPVSAPALSLLKTYSTPLSPEDGRCFLVTFAFDKYSPVYFESIRFRDRFLAAHIVGRFMIRLYYWGSPALISVFGESALFRGMIKTIVMTGWNLVRKKDRRGRGGGMSL